MSRNDADLLDALAQTSFAVMAVLQRIGAEHELSLTQLRVFGILQDRRPRMAELAEYLGLDKSTMSGLVDRAERKGILSRAKNAGDARAVDVYLTPAGHALAARIRAEISAALAPMVDKLDATERKTVARLLARMVGAR